MVSLDHPVVLSLLVTPRYLAIADAGRLELVSRRCRDFSRRYMQRLTRLNMHEVLETCTKSQVLRRSMADRFPNLVIAWDVKQEWLAAMASLPRLTTISVPKFKLNAGSLALLKSLPRLRALTVREVCPAERFGSDDEEPLHLHTLVVLSCWDTTLLRACRPELLTTLVLELLWFDQEMEDAYRVLCRLVNLQTLTLVNEWMAWGDMQPLFSAVAALPGLVQLCLEGHVHICSWSDLGAFCDDERIRRSLTSLRVDKRDGVDQQLASWTLPNLRHVQLEYEGADVEHIFNVQIALEKLEHFSETVTYVTESGAVFRCLVRSVTTRFVSTYSTRLHVSLRKWVGLDAQ